MEENNEYYTPTTEEFHIGFEYLMTFETRGKQEIIPNKFEGLTNDVYKPKTERLFVGNIKPRIELLTLLTQLGIHKEEEALGW